MNAEEFVDAIRSEVRDATVKDVLSLLKRPPGRKPAESLKSLSEWFNSLSENDRDQVREVAALASHHATFGLLAVLDGVRAIEDGDSGGKLELRHSRGRDSTFLNDPNGPLLHDLLMGSQ